MVVLGESSRCDAAGVAGPFGFKVAFWEKDSIDFDPGFCAVVAPGPGMHAGPHCVNDHVGDDFIGRADLVVFPVSDLGGTLPEVGDTISRR